MKDITVWILGSILLSLISALIGKWLGAKGVSDKLESKVSDVHCIERRKSCFLVVGEKIDNLDKKIDDKFNTIYQLIKDKI
jgi:hypothetical protein